MPSSALTGCPSSSVMDLGSAKNARYSSEGASTASSGPEPVTVRTKSDAPAPNLPHRPHRQVRPHGRRGGDQAQRPRRAGRPARHPARADEGRGDEDRPGPLDDRLRHGPRGGARGVQGEARRAARRRAERPVRASWRSCCARSWAGRCPSVFSEFGTEPVAAASIGQVHRARHARRPRRRGEGAVPGRRGGGRDRPAQHGDALPADPPDGAGAGRQGARAPSCASGSGRSSTTSSRRSTSGGSARVFRGHPHVFVPAVDTALSSRRVLVTEFVDGSGFASRQTAR